MARVKDVRPSYGATATILTEYLRAVDSKITPRLATALLYAIKADTLYLERGAARADVEAFGFLHPLANHNALRRIERPDLPETALDTLALGIARRRLIDSVLYTHLGPVGYPELVAQFADTFLQVEGAEWSVVSGIVNDDFIKALGPLAEGALAFREGAPAEKLPGGKKFLEDYNKQGYSNPPEAYGPFAYAAAELLMDAIEKVGPDRKKIIKELANVKDRDSIVGKITFDDHGQNTVPAITKYVVQDGKWVTWEDSEYASGKRKLTTGK